MKTFLFSFLALSLAFAGTALAQETSVEAVVEAETVTSADLGVEEPGLLPTSPFYFFKEIGRGFQRAFTFNSVAKTELELKIASEKAAEAAKVAEEDPSDERGISRALVNYERAQERLRSRLENLQETSENPNIDRLLDMIAERQIAHEKLLEGLEAKHETQKSTTQNIRARVQGIWGEIAEKDTAEKFQERIEGALEGVRGSTLKHIRSVEILDRLKESRQIPEEAKERLQQVRDNFSEKARENIEQFTEEGEEGANRLRDALQKIPGDSLKRTVILEEIRARATERTANALEEARDALDETVQEGKDFDAEARAQIARTEERLQKIEERMRELGDQTPQGVRTLLDNARKHLEAAKTALEQGNPRNAFGLSRAAEAIAANILRILEQGIDALGDTPQLLDRIRDRIQVPLPPFRDDTKVPPVDIPGVFCTEIYDPVCGVDGKTYGNRCEAEQQNKVRVAYKGECRDEVSDAEPCITASVTPGFLEECRAKGGEVGTKRKEGPPCVIGFECVVPQPTPVPPPTSQTDPFAPVAVPAPITRFIIEADDSSLSPSEIRVVKGERITLVFNVSRNNVYFGGLDFRSTKFQTEAVPPGGSTTVEFTADESFEFKSYWPASNVLKATGRVIVE